MLSKKLWHSLSTVLYRYGGDLFYALNVARGQVRNLTKKTADNLSTENNLSETCHSLNMKFHANMIEQDASSHHRIEDVDIESFIKDLDPDIWKAICFLTQPLSSTAKTGTDSSNHTCMIRRCFCVCILFFSTNSRCSFPMHTLIVDAVETCGGLSRLQKLLNRLGVCASQDTHARYIQHRVQKRMKEGPMATYPQDSFMLVSADNLDFVHSFTRVFSGKQQSSWHGTTVQVVQPQPLGLTEVLKTLQQHLLNLAIQNGYIQLSHLLQVLLSRPLSILPFQKCVGE